MRRAPRCISRLNFQASGLLLLSLLAVLSGAPLHAGCGLSVLSARYLTPTTAYPHGVLGDKVEWGELEITVNAPAHPSAAGASAKGSKQTGNAPKPARTIRKKIRLSASANSVFEDLEPRLWDITGDGCPEIIVVESHQRKGARLLAYVWLGDKLDLLATPHIGQRFRWLAPVGAADLNGNGLPEIAYIDRPHLAKRMRIWELNPVRFELREIAQIDALTNHKIGWDYISSGIRTCTNGPEFITADAAWGKIIATRFESGRYTKHVIAPYQGPQSIAANLQCP